MSNKSFIIKESTRQRCKIVKIEDEKTAKSFRPLSLELFHFLNDARKIDFSIYVRVEKEMIEFIKPSELSAELLKTIWAASQKEDNNIDICILKKDYPKFELVINSVRKKKIQLVLEKEPTLDKKVLDVFADLSNASQMILRGGITKEIVNQASSQAAYMMQNLMNNETAVGTLTRMIEIDPTLYDHSASVAMFSGILGKQYLSKKISEKDSIILAKCGLYHDAGKSCIPNTVLNKPGIFTEAEYEIMKTHATLGHRELLSAIKLGAEMDLLIPTVAHQHHERFLGQGYPCGLKGRMEDDPKTGIHLYARIVAIADTYSALLMKRIYKPAMEAEKAIEVMCKIAPKDFDPEIFYPFIHGVKHSLNALDAKKGGSGKIYQIDEKESFSKKIKDINSSKE